MNIPLRHYWDLLAKHIRPQRGRFVILTVLLLSSIGLQIFNPQIMRRFIDATQSSANGKILIATAITYIGLAILQQFVTVGASYFGENVAWTATNALRGELARHCINLDMSSTVRPVPASSSSASTGTSRSCQTSSRSLSYG